MTAEAGASGAASPDVPECTGECCRCIALPISPAELEQNHATYMDGGKLLMMLTAEFINTKGKWRYTCGSWDESTGRCRAYEQRPQMCRGYPYGEQCGYCGAVA